MEGVLAVKNITKSFGSKYVLQNLSFSVSHGEIFGFVGPNGAGKTTTMKILTGQLTADRGTVRIFELSPSTQTSELTYLLGIVPEETNLYERLTIFENLHLFCQLYGCDIQNIDYYLDRVGLLNESKTLVKRLSKGMKQRVLLTRALLHQPRLLLLDEPTSGLDPVSAAQIHRLLNELNQEGTTILLTTHDMGEIEQLCSRVAFINHGQICEIGAPEAIRLKHSNNQMIVKLETTSGLVTRKLSLNGEGDSKLLAQWMKESRVRSIHTCEPSLKDIFIRVTGGEL